MENYGQDGLQVVYDDSPLEYRGSNLRSQYMISSKPEAGISEPKEIPTNEKFKKTKYFRGPKLWLIVAVLVLLVALVVVIAVLVSKDNVKAKSSQEVSEEQPSPMPIATITSSPTTTFHYPKTATPSASSAESPTSPMLSATSPTLLANSVLPTSGILPSNCTSQSDTHSTEISGFNTTCNRDYGGFDFQNLTAYTFDQCLHACVSINALLGNGYCFVVSWFADITSSSPINCLLKNATSGISREPYEFGVSGNGQSVMIGAILLDQGGHY